VKCFSTPIYAKIWVFVSVAGRLGQTLTSIVSTWSVVGVISSLSELKDSRMRVYDPYAVVAFFTTLIPE